MHKTILISLLSITVLTGCASLKSGLKPYTMPEKTETNQVDEETKSAIERMAEEKHIPPELSDDFVSKYLDMNSFEELKERTKDGIAATQKTADLTEKEFQLWSDIIDTAMLNQYTVKDLEVKRRELYEILNQMAEEKGKELETMMETDYGMGLGDMKSFINKQAQKYVEPDKNIDQGNNEEKYHGKDKEDKAKE